MIKGKLIYGIEFNGVRHYDLELRLPTVAENIAALDKFPEGNQVQIELAMMVDSITKLGDVPKEDITYELLSTMIPQDYDYLADLVTAAKKKLVIKQED